MFALFAPARAVPIREAEHPPPDYTTATVEIVNSIQTNRSNIQRLPISNLCAKLLAPASRPHTFCEVLDPSKPARLFFDVDAYTDAQNQPSKAELEQAQASCAETITTFMRCFDQAFSPQLSLHAAERHRPVIRNGAAAFKVSLRFFVTGYRVLLSQLKRAVETARHPATGQLLFPQDQGWDSSVYPVNGQRLLNLVLCAKGKDGDMAVLRPLPQEDGTPTELHNFFVHYTQPSDLDLNLGNWAPHPPAVPPRGGDPHTPFALRPGVPHTPGLAPNTAASPVGLGPPATPLPAASPAPQLKLNGAGDLRKLQVSAMSALVQHDVVEGYHYHSLRGDSLYFQTEPGGRQCMEGRRHDSNNFVVKCHPSGELRFYCFSKRCTDVRWKTIGRWKAEPTAPTSLAQLHPAKLREFSPAFMVEAEAALKALPEDDPQHAAVLKTIVDYYNRFFTFVASGQPEIVQVMRRLGWGEVGG